MREMTLFYAPHVNSYKRFAPGSFAPTAVAWGNDNRTCSMRVVGHGEGLRFENRLPGADVNPYLALAAMIAAGLHGVDAELALEPPLEGNAYTADKPHTIYVGTGVRDDGGGINLGTATAFHCSNTSGVTATIRFLVLNNSGAVRASVSTSLNHGWTHNASTHNTAAYTVDTNLATGAVAEGVINIKSTESGVFFSIVPRRHYSAARPREPASRHGGVALSGAKRTPDSL